MSAKLFSKATATGWTEIILVFFLSNTGFLHNFSVFLFTK